LLDDILFGLLEEDPKDFCDNFFELFSRVGDPVLVRLNALFSFDESLWINLLEEPLSVSAVTPLPRLALFFSKCVLSV